MRYFKLPLLLKLDWLESEVVVSWHTTPMERLLRSLESTQSVTL